MNRPSTSVPARYDFYIAYSRGEAQRSAKYNQCVRELHRRLKADHHVFIDKEEIVPGDDWATTYTDALRTSLVVLAILPGPCGDRSYLPDAPYLRDEIALALHYRNRLVPIYPEGKPEHRHLPAGTKTLADIVLSAPAGSPEEDAVTFDDCVQSLLRSHKLAVDRTPGSVPPPPPPPLSAPINAGVASNGPVAIELTLSVQFDRFDQRNFVRRLATVFNLDAGALEIRLVAWGSVVLRLSGAASTLAKLANKLEAAASAGVKQWLGELRVSKVRLCDQDGRWTELRVPDLPHSNASHRAPPLDFDPHHIMEFRARLDRLFLESEVLALALRTVQSLPSVTGAILWLGRRTDRRLCAFAGNAHEGSLVGFDRASELAASALRERERRLLKPEGEGCWLVPLTEGKTPVGVLQVTFSSAEERPSEQLLSDLSSQVAAALRRVRRLQAYRDIARTTVQPLLVERVFDSMLEEITSLGFEYAAISIPDRFRGEIGIVAYRNMPPAWAQAATHPLAHTDIVAETYRTKQSSGVIEGWDKRLDQEIYHCFDHSELARVFLPILLDGACLGVVEYGATIGKRSALFTKTNHQRVNDILVRHAQPELLLIRPSALLQQVAEHALHALGADAASIHIYDAAAVSEAQLGKPALVVGAGLADADLIDYFGLGHGLGRKAMASRQTIIAHAREIEATHPELYTLGVRTGAAVPLLFDDERRAGLERIGVLWIDFRDGHDFDQAELEVMKDFARHVEIAIGNTLQIERSKRRSENALRYARVLDILRALGGNDLQSVLTKMVKSVLQLLGARNVVLYEYFREKDEFSKPIISGYFLDRDAMTDPMPSDGVARDVLAHGQSRFVEDVKDAPELLEPRPGRTRFMIREGIHSSATLVLKDGDEVVGVLFVNFKHPQLFSAADRMELQALAAAAGVAISRSRQSKMEAERRQQELDTIQAVIAAISQADLQSFASVLELILEKGMELVGAKVGVIMLRDARSVLLRSIAVRGFPSLNLPILQPISEGIVGRAARTLESQLARNVNESPWKDIYRPTVPETISELAVPIVDRSGAVGVINFEASTPGAFSELARARGESLARQVLLVLSCIEHFQEPISHEQMVRLVADRLDDANLDRDACLRVVLTGVTAGQGLGFSRAMLFVLEGSIPKPVVALGALTRTEAEAIWTELDARFVHWRDSTPEGESSGRQAERMLRRLLDAASVTISGDSGTPLERFLRSCAVALVDPNGALAQCIQSGEARILASEAQDPLRSELRSMAGNGVASETWFVPVIYENRTLGALVVDSEFLPEAQQPPTRARLRTGSEQALLEVVQRFAQLLGTIVARGSVW